jgi:hypothetical protein
MLRTPCATPDVAALALDPTRDPAGQCEIEQANYKFRLLKKGGEEMWEQTYI